MDLKEYRKKLIGNEDKRAVSPVIGVILMVAITVILAAVIAAFVLDIGDNMGSEAQAGVQVNTDTGAAETQVTWAASGNADYLEATIDLEDTAGNSDSHENVEISNVGGTHTFSHDDSELSGLSMDSEDASGEIIVTATTPEGDTTVVSSETVEWDEQ